MNLFSLFSKNKITLRVTLPKGLRIDRLEEKITFVGTMDEISKFAQEIRKISKLNDGALASVDQYIFKVSGYRTDDGFRKNWIELPGRGWGVMASKFLEVVERYEENPFWFNSCGYTAFPGDSSPILPGNVVLPGCGPEPNQAGTIRHGRLLRGE